LAVIYSSSESGWEADESRSINTTSSRLRSNSKYFLYSIFVEKCNICRMLIQHFLDYAAAND
jgi:hypothetical protein